MRNLFTALAFMLVTGCATVPESLQVQDEQKLLNYPQVAANPEGSVNQGARWGGVIANVENLADTTLVEMVHYPLRAYGKPIISDESIGRFRVYVDGFLDPMVFEQGRSITFVGQVLGIEEGLVGEHNYQFPTLHADGYHLWREVETVDVTSIHFWPYSHWYGFYHPHFGLRHRVVISNDRRGTSSSHSSNTQSSTQRQPRPERPKRSELERVMNDK